MKPLKFKLWNKEEEKFEDEIYTEVYENNIPINECINFWQDTHVFLQFTGLIDKHGREIYEGDIITKDGKVNGEVIYNTPAFTVLLRKKEIVNKIPLYGFIGEQKTIILSGILDKDCKVIGNIYQNKNLL